MLYIVLITIAGLFRKYETLLSFSDSLLAFGAATQIKQEAGLDSEHIESLTKLQIIFDFISFRPYFLSKQINLSD